jgi:hypothetical protein
LDDLIQCGEPQSSSASRLTAGALGFLTFTQCDAKAPAAWRYSPQSAATLTNFEALFKRVNETLTKKATLGGKTTSA